MFRSLLLGWMTLGLAPTLVAGTPSFIHEFAQVGDGGGIRSVFLVLNQNAGEVTITLEFFKDDGTALTLTIEGTTASSFEFKAPARGTLRLQTSGSSATAQAGWARLTATGAVGAQLLFEILVDGKLVTQAAVEPTGPLRAFDLFMRAGDGTNSGIALANITNISAVNVRLTLRNNKGEEIATKTVQVASQGHLAQFISELFSEVGDIDGSLHGEASGPVTVIALQQTGLVLGTLPFVGKLSMKGAENR